MRAWRKPNASCPGRAGSSGRMSSLRTRPVSCDATASACLGGESSTTPPTWKISPSTEARSMTRRSSGVRWSSRAASSAWIAGGTATSPASSLALGQHGEHLLEEERVSLGGLGDAAARLRGELGSRRKGADEHRRLVLGERLEQDGGGVELAARPARAARRAARAGRGRRSARERFAPSRRGARSGRAGSARPSGRPRRRARAAGPVPAPRPACGRPRRPPRRPPRSCRCRRRCRAARRSRPRPDRRRAAPGRSGRRLPGPRSLSQASR